MPLYESVFIARQDISSAQAEQLTTEFSEIITNMGGEIKNTEFWGLRSLSYKIKKNRKGHYVVVVRAAAVVSTVVTVQAVIVRNVVIARNAVIANRPQAKPRETDP